MTKFKILAPMSKVFPEWMPILVNRLSSSLSNRISDLLDWQVHVARIRAAYLQINSSLESSYPPCFVPLSKSHDDISHIRIYIYMLCSPLWLVFLHRQLVSSFVSALLWLNLGYLGLIIFILSLSWQVKTGYFSPTSFQCHALPWNFCSDFHMTLKAVHPVSYHNFSAFGQSSSL